MKAQSIGPTRQRSVGSGRVCGPRSVNAVLRPGWPLSRGRTRNWREVAVLGSRDLQAHFAAVEFKDVVGADVATPALGAERGLARLADHRHVLDFSGHHDRLPPPVPRHARPLARRLRWCLVLAGRRGSVLAFADRGPDWPEACRFSDRAGRDRHSIATANWSSSPRPGDWPACARLRGTATPDPQAPSAAAPRGLLVRYLGHLRDAQARHGERKKKFVSLRQESPSVRRLSQGSQPSQTPKTEGGV